MVGDADGRQAAGRRRPAACPATAVMFSFGSVGSTPSPGTTRVGQSRLYQRGGQARSASSVRRSIVSRSFILRQGITPFSFGGQGVLFAP